MKTNRKKTKFFYFVVEFSFLETQESLKFSGSNLNETFKLAQFHFHWGENNYEGSEHYLNTKKYPLEVKFYFKPI